MNGHESKIGESRVNHILEQSGANRQNPETQPRFHEWSDTSGVHKHGQQ